MPPQSGANGGSFASAVAVPTTSANTVAASVARTGTPTWEPPPVSADRSQACEPVNMNVSIATTVSTEPPRSRSIEATEMRRRVVASTASGAGSARSTTPTAAVTPTSVTPGHVTPTAAPDAALAAAIFPSATRALLTQSCGIGGSLPAPLVNRPMSPTRQVVLSAGYDLRSTTPPRVAPTTSLPCRTQTLPRSPVRLGTNHGQLTPPRAATISPASATAVQGPQWSAVGGRQATGFAGGVPGPARDASPVRAVSPCRYPPACSGGGAVATAPATSARQMSPPSVHVVTTSSARRAGSPTRVAVTSEMAAGRPVSQGPAIARSVSPCHAAHERTPPRRHPRASAPLPNASVREVLTPGRREAVPVATRSMTSSSSTGALIKAELDASAASATSLGPSSSRISLGSGSVPQFVSDTSGSQTCAVTIPAAPLTPSSADGTVGGSSASVAGATPLNYNFRSESGSAALAVTLRGSPSDTANAVGGAASLSEVPEVLRQHLDRRKAQLQSMQQRLAKLTNECDRMQGEMASAEG